MSKQETWSVSDSEISIVVPNEKVARILYQGFVDSKTNVGEVTLENGEGEIVLPESSANKKNPFDSIMSGLDEKQKHILLNKVFEGHEKISFVDPINGEFPYFHLGDIEISEDKDVMLNPKLFMKKHLVQSTIHSMGSTEIGRMLKGLSESSGLNKTFEKDAPYRIVDVIVSENSESKIYVVVPSNQKIEALDIIKIVDTDSIVKKIKSDVKVMRDLDFKQFISGAKSE